MSKLEGMSLGERANRESQSWEPFILSNIKDHDFALRAAYAEGFTRGYEARLKRKPKYAATYHKDARSVLHILNETCGRGFRETDTNLTIISQRLKEPEVTFEGVGLMIARQCQKWMNTTMADYLRPATLFGKEKFDAYYAAREQPVILADDPKAAAARQAKMDFVKAMLK